MRNKILGWTGIASGGLFLTTGILNILGGRIHSGAFAAVQAVALALAALMLYGGIRALSKQTGDTRRNRTVCFAPDDPEMTAAIDEAKRTLDEFMRAYLEPGANQRGFLLKVFFDDEDEEQSEHIWVADVEETGTGFRGVIANEPVMLSLRFQQPVEFEAARITDWMFIDNGRLVGGYTTRLIRQRMSQEERAAFDAAVEYSF
jgi:uncharacterized protein YegJ (DUF2314 family)